MGLLTKPEDLTGSATIKGLIYGQPGIGKTTLALSSPKPVCIDFDKGMTRVDPNLRVPSLQVDLYSEVLELISSGELDEFDTIVIDTLGKLVDKICDHVTKANSKNRQGNGQMTMQGWGQVKITFMALFKLLDSMGKSIIFVAHESEEKDGDETIKRPDCAGSARKDIVKELDFMGYMEMRGNKRTISFTPSDKFYAKNSLHLGAHIEIPSTENGNNFITTEVIQLNNSRLKDEAKLRTRYNDIIASIDTDIAALQSVDDVNSYYKDMGKKLSIWDSHEHDRKGLSNQIKELGIVFNPEQRVFEAIKIEKESDVVALTIDEILANIDESSSVDGIETFLKNKDVVNLYDKLTDELKRTIDEAAQLKREQLGEEE